MGIQINKLEKVNLLGFWQRVKPCQKELDKVFGAPHWILDL
jgi:hypothetical protein